MPVEGYVLPVSYTHLDVYKRQRETVEMSAEWRFWKKAYWSDFNIIKPTINLSVVLGALSLMMLKDVYKRQPLCALADRAGL